MSRRRRWAQLEKKERKQHEKPKKHGIVFPDMWLRTVVRKKLWPLAG